MRLEILFEPGSVIVPHALSREEDQENLLMSLTDNLYGECKWVMIRKTKVLHLQTNTARSHNKGAFGQMLLVANRVARYNKSLWHIDNSK